MELKNVKDRIREFAKSIDIELIGFSDVFIDNKIIEFLKAKRERGHLSGFEERDENKRSNINCIMEGARTVISIGLPYRTTEIDKDEPYFSKASLGLDYHYVVLDRLNKIKGFIEGEYGARCMEFCDNNPLLEREFAYKCGIGFYGKNNCIINEKYGSYIFLGEILTDLYIEPDLIVNKSCGSCDLCLKACPTGALKSPYYIDPKKCLSYITQRKDLLSDDNISEVGLRIYGCDTCQDACPYNKASKLSNITEFVPEKWNINPDYRNILKMGKKEFNDTFKKTSSGWRGLKNLKRNTIIALSNSKNDELIKMIMDYTPNNDELKYYIEKIKGRIFK